MNDTKYANIFLILSVFFNLIGISLIVLQGTHYFYFFPGLTPVGLAGILCCWYGMSCFWVSSAFSQKRPEMILGKGEKRRFALLCVYMNLPFLVTYWTVWIFRHCCFRVVPCHRVGETNLTISQWPIFGVPLDSFDLVIDVTSEMPKLYKTRGKYMVFPNLDGVPLRRFAIPHDIDIDRRTQILVHCAQGRGRSAIMTALLLVKLGYAATGEEAFMMIRESRPNVTVSKAQMEQIRSFGTELSETEPED